jgi:hypothetical protein
MNPVWDQLDEHDRQHFAQHWAPALTRCETVQLAARRALWREWCVAGAIGLIGLAVLRWPPALLALLLLGGFWLGWLVDLLLWCLRAHALAVGAAIQADDARVWQIVAQLRGQRRAAPVAGGGATLGVGLVVDLVAGSVATVLLWYGLEAAGADPGALLTQAALWSGLGAMLLLGVVPSLPARFRRDPGGAVPPPLFQVGQRGLGLLLWVFALRAAGGGALAPAMLVGGAFAFQLGMGLIELRIGLPRLQADAEWLRSQRPAGCDSAE